MLAQIHKENTFKLDTEIHTIPDQASVIITVHYYYKISFASHVLISKCQSPKKEKLCFKGRPFMIFRAGTN